MKPHLAMPFTVAAALFSYSALAQDPHDTAHNGHDAQPSDMADPCTLPMGRGVINAINVANAEINLHHEPVETLGWDEMVMDFSVAKIVDLAAFYEGEQVHFMLAPGKDKTWSVAMMCSLETDDGAHQACMKTMRTEQARIGTEAGNACTASDAGGHQHH